MQKIAQFVVNRVGKSFNGADGIVFVLRNLSATFERGVIYAITGASGIGKSTFMHILAGIETPTEGTILLDGEDILKLSQKQTTQLRTKRIGLVFQMPYLIQELSVVENVMLPGLILGESRENCRARAEILLKNVGLQNKGEEQPASLSGGQQQRVALARALCNNPEFLLADEPTGNLDAETGASIIALILRMQREYHMGVIISTHDEQIARKADVVYELTRDGLTQVQTK